MRLALSRGPDIHTAPYIVIQRCMSIQQYIVIHYTSSYTTPLLCLPARDAAAALAMACS